MLTVREQSGAMRDGIVTRMGRNRLTGSGSEASRARSPRAGEGTRPTMVLLILLRHAGARLWQVAASAGRDLSCIQRIASTIAARATSAVVAPTLPCDNSVAIVPGISVQRTIPSYRFGARTFTRSIYIYCSSIVGAKRSLRGRTLLAYPTNCRADGWSAFRIGRDGRLTIGAFWSASVASPAPGTWIGNLRGRRRTAIAKAGRIHGGSIWIGIPIGGAANPLGVLRCVNKAY